MLRSLRKLSIAVLIFVVPTLMAATTVLNSFNRGELSPFLEGRSDVKAYYSGARTCENFTVLAQGGITKRPGTEYIGNIPGIVSSDDRAYPTLRELPASKIQFQVYFLCIQYQGV